MKRVAHCGHRCSTCSGRGNKTCATCKGERKLEHFVQLVIMWKNSLFEFMSPHHLHCPKELLAKARGENLFRDENATVYPIVDFPLQDISLASQRGIEEHSTMLASRARILQQMRMPSPPFTLAVRVAYLESISRRPIFRSSSRSELRQCSSWLHLQDLHIFLHE